MRKIIVILLTSCLVVAGVKSAFACPFCSAVSQTITQEIEAADVSVIAKLMDLPLEMDLDSEPTDLDLDLDLDDLDSGTAEFEVVEVIRGADAPAAGSKINVVYFGSNDQKKQFLVNGLVGQRIDWTNPLPLTERGVDYIKSLDGLPEQGADRLAFFLNHLEDEDPLLAQDAYDEFGRAPYEEVIAVGDRMDRQQLLDWIEDSGVGPTRRRLYLTMLGICGQPEDVAVLRSLLLYDYQQMKPGIVATFATMANAGPIPGVTVLNEMVKADVRRKQQCLDALIAAYLKLKGPDGLPLIEERFLVNPAAEYTHVYAAVMALRFHGEETDEIPRERLLETVRLVLDNPQIADQVIPDLARWEDWDVMDKLVAKFKESEPNAWIRQPVIAYLLAAEEQPSEIRDRAKAAIAELEAIDPKAVKQARSYMAFGLLARAKARKPSSEKKQEKDFIDVKGDARGDDSNTADIRTRASGSAIAENQTASKIPASGKPQEIPSVTLDAGTTPPGPSTMVIVGGPLIAGVFLLGIFALLLRGADVRNSSSDS